MQARAADFIRTAPRPAARSAGPDSARPGTDAGEPKPRSRFDDELNRHTKVTKEPKAESHKSDPASKARSRKDDHAKPVDDASPADATQDADTTDAEAAAVESDESSAKAEQTKTKPTKKVDAKKTDADDDAIEDAGESHEATGPVKGLPAEATTTEGDLVIDADDSAKTDTKKTETDTAVDPDAVAAAQLVAQQAASQPPASVDLSTDLTEAADATSTTPKVSAAAKPGATPTTDLTAATGEADKAAPHQTHSLKATDATAVDADADAEAAGAFQLPPEVEKAAASTAKKDDAAALPAAIQPTASHEKPSAPAPLPPTTPQAAPPRDVAEHNVDQIVTSVRGELLTKGGTMDIRLDPPTLGQVQIQITVEDGVLSANLQTNNDEATRLLSHNLAQLKTQLESAGVTVDRIQVKQATPAEQSNSSSNQQNADGDPRQQSATHQDQSARQEQQRREALQRMWARVAGNGDPLDLVA